MPNMGPATAACKTSEEKVCPGIGQFFNKSPRGDRLSIRSFEKRARWCGFGIVRDNTQCCPSVNQIPVMSQFISQKKESGICQENHGPGSGVC